MLHMSFSHNVGNASNIWTLSLTKKTSLPPIEDRGPSPTDNVSMWDPNHNPAYNPNDNLYSPRNMVAKNMEIHTIQYEKNNLTKLYNPNSNPPPYPLIPPAIERGSGRVVLCTLRPLTLTFEVWPWPLTLTFNPWRTKVITPTRANGKGQMSLGLKVRVVTDGQTDGRRWLHYLPWLGGR